MPEEYRDADEMTFQIKELKRQLSEIEAKLDYVLSSQAIIIGVLNGTIDLGPFNQQDAAKMH